MCPRRRIQNSAGQSVGWCFAGGTMMGKRLNIIFITALVLSLGIPVWWETTAVHRENLPVEDVYLWHSKQKWPLFSKLFTGYPPGFPEKVVKASPAYKISFTLANADPKSVLPEWDFSVVEDFFTPILDKLSIIAEFSVDSQVFHYASLLKAPKFESKTSTHYLPADQISQFINPNEWKPDFTSTNLPTINFIIYVPSTPTKIQLRTGQYSPSNSILIPQWGGIAIYNTELANETTLQPRQIQLGCAELQSILPIFAGQLHELLGAKHSSELSEAQLTTLKKIHLSENIFTSANTLLSLSNLVNNLTNMVVLEHISSLVQTSVDNLNKAHTALQSKDVTTSLMASREALRAAQLAFFDPSMLALLYFPDEHKYAIYTPLFLPVGFPILAALMQEIKHRKKKRKEEKEKKE